MSSTTVYLIRHAHAEIAAGRLPGRMPIPLSAAGREQADAVSRRLATVPIAALYSSPTERARETAEIIGNRVKLPVLVSDGLIELDYGTWTGLTYEEANQNTEWAMFNNLRSFACIPAGESVLDVTRRALMEVQALCRRHPGHTVAVVSHAEVIRIVLAYCLGLALDLSLRIEVNPASISIVRMDDSAPRILMINGSPQ